MSLATKKRGKRKRALKGGGEEEGEITAFSYSQTKIKGCHSVLSGKRKGKGGKKGVGEGEETRKKRGAFVPQ